MTDIALLAAHLRGEHTNERLPGCTACEALPPVSVEEPPAPRVDPGTPSTGRKCHCGCGSSVKRRFLPGHDAKLKGRLVREARSGSDAAKQQLEEYGWTKFI